MSIHDLFANARIHWWLKNLGLAAIIGAVPFLIQGIWAASNAVTRIETLEHQMALIGPISERLARLEGKVDSIKEGVDRVTKLILLPPPERR